MRQDNIDLIEFIQENGYLSQDVILCDWYACDRLLQWKIPKDFTQEDINNQLDSLREIGIE